VIVDTSALIAILRREPEGDRFTDALLAASEPKMSVATLLEARMIAQRDNGAAELEALINAAGIEIVSTDLAQIDLAFEGFLRFGKGRHPAGLNFGDLFAYALARTLDEPLLYKGEAFGQTDVRSA
jgi:ribonuclease VapC